MAYPNISSCLEYLGHPAKDKITGFEGIIVCVQFDLYGCVQVVLNPGLDNDKKPQDSHWFDIQRCEILGDRVMQPPFIDEKKNPSSYEQGPAEKPGMKAL